MSDERAREAAEAWATAAEPRQPETEQPETEQPETEEADPELADPELAGPGQPGVDQSGDGASHEALVEHDLDELAARAEKADEYLELAKRTRADFDNYRKRAARETAFAQERGISRLAKELLPAIDNLDRAVQAAEPEESQLVSGIKLVQADLLAALARAGIEPFSPVGEAFDPQWHEAVAQVPIEGSESGAVVEVYQQGYRLGETVLRPARVLVAA